MMERALAWLTESERSTYGVAVTRIMIGFVVSSQLLLNWPDRSYTWGEGGRWNETVADVKGYPEFFGLFRALDGWQWDVAYLLVVLSGIALMLGVFTRITTVTTVILWASVYVANPYVGSGGDAVLRMVLFYLCFTDAGQKWSVDAWLRDRRGYRTRILPQWVSAILHNLAVVLMIHQIVMVYV
ncbi:MAG: HTTM domain-containing protein, partial [Aeromicrobium sp.]